MIFTQFNDILKGHLVLLGLKPQVKTTQLKVFLIPGKFFLTFGSPVTGYSNIIFSQNHTSLLQSLLVV